MKKGLSILALLSVMGASVFAQNYKPTSNTSSSTAGLFSTDVDNFIDITDWASVNPENFFGVLGYDGVYGLQLGAAKNLKNGYHAIYLDGNLGWNFTNTSSTTYTGDDKNKTTTDTGNTSSFRLNYLFGKDKTSYKAGLAYSGFADDIKTKSDTLKSNVQHFYFSPYFMYGTAVKGKKYDLTPYAGIRFYENVNKTKTVNSTGTDPVTNVSNTSTGGLVLSGGINIDLGKKDKFSHSANVDGSATISIYPSKSASGKVGDTTSFTKSSGRSNLSADISGEYTAYYDINDKLSIGGTVYSNLTASTSSGAKKTVVSSAGTKTETALAYTKTTTFNLYNSAYFGLKYAANKTVQLNAGASVILPTVTFTGSSSYNTDNKKTNSSTTFTGNSVSCPLNLYSGANFNLGNIVNLDVYANVLGNLLTSTLDSKWATGTGTNFWNNVNNIVFPSFGIIASVKF